MKITNLKDKVISCGLLLVAIAVMYFFSLPCPFLALFKIPCPGCGMTRAYLSLMHLDLIGAFSFHPMFWSVPVLFLLYLFDGKIFKRKWMNTLLMTGIVAGFFISWIVKLILA